MNTEVLAVLGTGTVTLTYTAASLALSGIDATTGKRTETPQTQTWTVDRKPSRTIRPRTEAGPKVSEMREYEGKAADITLNGGKIVPGLFRVTDGSDKLEIVEVNYTVDRTMVRIVCSMTL